MSAFIVMLSTAGLVLAQEAKLPADLEQLVQRIAATIGATNPNASSDSPIVQKTSSHGNIVEIRTYLQSSSAFAKMSADRISYENGLINFYCKPERLPYLNKGIVFQYIVVGPGGSGSFDFLIDDKSCASSARSSRSDTQNMVRTTQDLAQEIASALSKEQDKGDLKYESTTVQGDEIQVVEVIESAELADRIRKQEYKFRGITQGWFCGKFGSGIKSGIRVHVIYKLKSGQTIIDISIDNSIC